MGKEKPLNKFEVDTLVEILGLPLLSGLTGIGGVKLVHGMFGKPPIPWAKVETKRLRFLQKLVKQLKGSYNIQGIRQWFRRNRPQLENKRPGDFLYKINWYPEDPNIQKLLELAKSVEGGAT